MKSINLGSFQPVSTHWRTHARHMLRAARSESPVRPDPEPTIHSFDDSQHPVWAIASSITIFFLVVSVCAFFVLMADAIWTHS